jgi:hypothetical protein
MHSLTEWEWRDSSSRHGHRAGDRRRRRGCRGSRAEDGRGHGRRAAGELGAQVGNKIGLDVGQKTAQLARLRSKGYKKLVARQPAAEPRRRIEAPPTVSSLDSGLLELGQTTGEAALNGLVVPDDPDATSRRRVGCPRQGDLALIGRKDVIERVQVPASSKLQRSACGSKSR